MNIQTIRSINRTVNRKHEPVRVSRTLFNFSPPPPSPPPPPPYTHTHIHKGYSYAPVRHVQYAGRKLIFTVDVVAYYKDVTTCMTIYPLPVNRDREIGVGAGCVCVWGGGGGSGGGGGGGTRKLYFTRIAVKVQSETFPTASPC